MPTARQEILRTLAMSTVPLAVHELGIPWVSDTAASARLRELAREGLVVGARAQGKPYKVWTISPDSLSTPTPHPQEPGA